MQYENLSPALAMMAYQLSRPKEFAVQLTETQKRLAKVTKRTSKNRLK